MRAIFLLLFLSHTTALATVETTSEWHQVLYKDTGVTSYIHDNSLEKGAPTSYLSLYPAPAGSTSVRKLVEEIKNTDNLDRSLLPNSCYHLKRPDLKSRQTWCEKKDGGYLAIVEEGPKQMRENERARAVFSALHPETVNTEPGSENAK